MPVACQKDPTLELYGISASLLYDHFWPISSHSLGDPLARYHPATTLSPLCVVSAHSRQWQWCRWFPPEPHVIEPAIRPAWLCILPIAHALAFSSITMQQMPG